MYIIDFDDTLFDAHHFKQALNEALLDLGVSQEDVDWSYAEARRLPDGQYSYSHERRAELLVTRGYNKRKILPVLERAGSPELLESYLLPGAKHFLETLRATKQPLVLLSLGDPSFQEKKVHGTGITKYFDRLFFVSDSKQSAITELVSHHKPTEYWLINDKVQESLDLVAAFPEMRVVLRQAERIAETEYVNSGLYYFSHLNEILDHLNQSLSSPKHHSAGAVVYRQNESANQVDVVVMKREKTNTWHLPKGTMELNESIAETALREVKEESNVDCLLEDYLLAIPSRFTRDEKRREKITFYYKAKYIGGELRSTDGEHDQVFWLPLDKALQEFYENKSRSVLGYENEYRVLDMFAKSL